MPRIKVESFATRAEFEAAVDRVAALEINRRRAEAERDAQVQAVLEAHAPALTAQKAEIDGLVARASAYAKEHRAELIAKGKQGSDTGTANYGFRWSTKSLALLSATWSWPAVIESLLTAGMDRFVRVRKEVDKDAVKDQLPEATLAQHGMRVRQTETFWVEPKPDLL